MLVKATRNITSIISSKPLNTFPEQCLVPQQGNKKCQNNNKTFALMRHVQTKRILLPSCLIDKPQCKLQILTGKAICDLDDLDGATD